MKNNTNRLSQYKTLISLIEGIGWLTSISAQERYRAINRAVSDSVVTGVLGYELADSLGTVEVIMPDQTHGNLAHINLRCPLDPLLPQSDMYFKRLVAQTHKSIGLRHESGYAVAQQHSVILLKAFIPEDFDREVLLETLSAFQAAATEANMCHQLVRSPLEVFSQNQ
jgi:hypothetical protein